MERKTIKVVSVGQWKPVGKAQVLSFAGEDRVNYETWSQELAEYIKVGATIEADVEFSQKEHEGKVYLHNKVVQIYIDGQPVKVKQRNWSSDDSPEKRASIESQKRAELICQLWIAGKIVDNDPLVVKARAWLSLLGITPQMAPEATRVPISKPYSEVKAALLKDPEFRKEYEKASIFDNAGEFLTACQKLGLNRTQVLQKLGIKTLDKVNFTDAYIQLKENPGDFDKMFPPV